MSRPHLKGATVLVVEDEPLIAMDIALAFKGSGAHFDDDEQRQRRTIVGGAR